MLASVYVFGGTLQEILAFFMATTLAFVALAAGALFVVRRRPGSTPPFQSPGYPLTPALFLVLVTAVVLLVAVSRPVQALAGFALVAAGIPVYGIFARQQGPAHRMSR